MEVKQYEFYWVNLDPTIGREMKKTRSCLVLSPNKMNDNIGTVIVAPLSYQTRSYPSRVKCSLEGKNGMIAIDQLKTIDKKRLQKRIATANEKVIQQVKQVISEMLVQ